VISISRRADVQRMDEFIGPKKQPVPSRWCDLRHTEMQPKLIK
jgi:hypothetical protein